MFSICAVIKATWTNKWRPHFRWADSPHVISLRPHSYLIHTVVSCGNKMHCEGNEWHLHRGGRGHDVTSRPSTYSHNVMIRGVKGRPKHTACDVFVVLLWHVKWTPKLNPTTSQRVSLSNATKHRFYYVYKDRSFMGSKIASCKLMLQPEPPEIIYPSNWRRQNESSSLYDWKTSSPRRLLGEAAIQQPDFTKEDAVDKGDRGELVQLKVHFELEFLFLHHR